MDILADFGVVGPDGKQKIGMQGAEEVAAPGWPVGGVGHDAPEVAEVVFDVAV